MSKATHSSSLPTSTCCSSSTAEPKNMGGTNLNKLTKPPPAATNNNIKQANSCSRGSQQLSSSSRGGLLVLSTKRSSLKTGTAKGSSGGAPKPVNTPSLRSEAVTSYDALQIGLSADTDAGAAVVIQTQPTAWGVVDQLATANNASTTQSNTNKLPVLAPKGGVGYGDRRRVSSEGTASLKRSTSTTNDNMPSKLSADNKPRPDTHATIASNLTQTTNKKGEVLTDKNEGTNKNVNEQQGLKSKNINEPVSKLSKETTHHDDHVRKHIPRPTKERPENRRVKEDMTVIPQDIIVPPTIKPRQAAASTKDAEVVLELLGPKHSAGNAKGPTTATASNETIDKNKVKAMVKSAKTFSSLVGGTDQKQPDPPPPSNQQPASSMEDVPPVPFIQLSSYDDRDRGERTGPRMLFDPKSGSMVAVPSDKRGATSFAKESKPRKDRPRPKSRARDKDSLTAQQPLLITKRELADAPFRRNKKSNDDAAPLEDLNSRGGGRRSNSNRTQNNLITPSSVESTNITNTQQSTNNKNNKIKIPRTCGVLYKFDVHGNYISADGCHPDQGYGSHSVPGGRKRYPHAYAKYLEQQRILAKQQQHHLPYNNSTTATKSMHHNGLASNLSQSASNDIHQQHHPHHSARKLGFYAYDPHHPTATSNFYHTTNESSLSATNQNNNDALKQQSHHSLSYTMKTSVGYNNYFPPSSSQIPKKKIESKNISILDPELSPELQATANPWAPNEAALAYSNQLAAAAATSSSSRPPDTTHSPNRPNFELAADNNNSDNEECEASQSFEGLGFDPTENMDTVIMSPSVHVNDDENILDFQSLTLNHPDLNTHSSSSGGAKDLKPFALTSPSRILDASTWSTAGVPLTRSPGRIGTAIGGGVVPTSSALNWNLLGAESSSGETPPPPHHHHHHLRSAAEQRSNSSDPNNTRTNNAPSAATFLSLSPLSTHHRDGVVVNWGTPGGLGGGIDIAGLSSMRPTKSSKDTSE